jgi:hypothetical protein
MSRYLKVVVFMLAGGGPAVGCNQNAPMPQSQVPPEQQAPPAYVYYCAPGPTNVDHSNDDKISVKALELLKVAEDGTLPCSIRMDAVHKLGRRRESEVVDRLAKLLPGDSDIMTGEVIESLGEIGGSKALAVLESCEGNPAYDNGKLQVELHAAIKKCRKGA